MSSEAGEYNQPSEGERSSEHAVPWTVADLILSLVAGVALGILGGGVTAALLFSVADVSGAVVFAVIGIEIYASVALMVWVLVVLRRRTTWRELGLRPVPRRAILLMIPVTVGVLIVNGVVSSVTSAVFGEVPTARDQLAISDEITALDFVLLFIAVVLVGPVVEEVVFRGLLYRFVRAKAGVRVAVAVSALAFSLTHFIPLLVGVFFVFGLVLAAAAERYESLYPPIVIHALVNATAIVLLYGAQ